MQKIFQQNSCAERQSALSKLRDAAIEAMIRILWFQQISSVSVFLVGMALNLRTILTDGTSSILKIVRSFQDING